MARARTTTRISIVRASIRLAAGLALAAAPLATAKNGSELNDITIADAISDELLYDEQVDSTEVTVTVDDGVATLTGEVDDLIEKRRSARIARTVRGVEMVENEITVDPDGPTGQELAADVEDELLVNPATDSFEIEASATGGAVTLEGTVESFREKSLAERVAGSVSGVTEIENDIDVEPEMQRSDSEIRAEVLAALRWNVYVDAGLIDVRVNDGTVTLEGTVGSASERARAVRLAYVQGVEEVVAEHLDVDFWARNPDLKQQAPTDSPGAVEDAVEQALFVDPLVNATDVRVEVSGNTATLRGTVPSAVGKSAATTAADAVAGVKRVRNRLTVDPLEPVTDSRLGSRIDSAILRDPVLEAYEIAVEVEDGVAKLYGSVDTIVEKRAATDTAMEIAGVVGVNNLLEVSDRSAVLYPDPYTDPIDPMEPDFGDYEAPDIADKADTELVEDTYDQLWWSPFVDSDDITVTAEDGEVTLAGEVDSYEEMEAAIDNAYDAGASIVTNNLEVTG